MMTGVLCGLLAGALWGLVFVTPLLLPAFTPWELSVGRYVCYGLIALVFLGPGLGRTVARIDRHDLTAMVRHALAGNIVYYVLLAYGVQWAGIAPTSLIIGLLPLVVTLMGRRDHGAVPLRTLRWPLLVVGLGMVCINVDVFTHTDASAAAQGLGPRMLGIACAVGALLCWSWYTVDNTRYLKQHAKFTGGQWSALYGLSSGVMALLIGGVGLALFGSRITDRVLAGQCRPGAGRLHGRQPTLEHRQPAGSGHPLGPAHHLRNLVCPAVRLRARAAMAAPLGGGGHGAAGGRRGLGRAPAPPSGKPASLSVLPHGSALPGPGWKSAFFGVIDESRHSPVKHS
jgi:drug/metabolite transporter (DMT)-like permease